MEEKFYQFPFTDSKPYTSNGRVNSFRRGPAQQKHEMWDSDEDSGNVDLENRGLSLSLASSSPEEVIFIRMGATVHQREPAFPENDFQQQAEPSLPNNMKAAFEKPSGCCSTQPKPPYSQHSPPLPLLQLLPSDTDAGLAGACYHSDSVVTGVQRFRDMLKIPYKLELKNEPGRADLKHIVIDGCNVAMAHGLNKVFSCRGIAIAVEYSWMLGHRNITVFVPQWRTRRNPNVTEQHFLTQLHELGMLSLTPSRTGFGKRIASRIDRFLLHLADKTGGVIVSNDKFREFVTESVSWREIINKRLLRYMFVGDIFMVPDDFLGRNWPRLEEFLGKEGFVSDMEPLLNALPNVDWFAQSHNTQVANTRHQPPYGNLGAYLGPWFPQQTYFTSLASILGIEQNHLVPVQRSSAETSELREAQLKVSPDSQQKQKIEEILVARPFLKGPEHSFWPDIEPKSGLRAGASDHNNSIDTCVQRFRDMLKIPYKLELKNEPGRADLKHIVIDGCNVAMAHGLNKVFSCRGIATAVEYFWKLGHRNITVFVPQWRTRRNPIVTEQHFLTQLKDLGMLSLTPSRTGFGKRFASHVDRFLLHLADKTGGVIVSNDKFREFVNESVSWREIIAKRLLQYTFVGDIFMVPDDPLGRNGPRLEEFLGKEGFVRDMEPLLNALPNVDWFAQSHNNQVANTRHQPPYGNLGASSGPWLTHQPHFTSLASNLGIEQNHLVPVQRSSTETRELREAPLKVFPDSQQKQKIEEILVARPFLEGPECSFWPDIGPKSGLRAGASDHNNSVVTWVQRFRDMLKIPYKLELKNKPGRADLKPIFIDGCNVAMAHGLNKVFSCRGIATAVEYFWKLGHRNITVFMPQWRTRRNPNVTEQHFLTQLKDLGMLSLTPSRTGFGKRIASHVHRCLLHSADKTGGVIVSNDKFREFVNESVSWREIIAKRLLQYTFVGDIFMVPDDPLGRNGPRLEEFLGKEGFVRDMEPLLNALPNVDWFAQSHNTQVANTRHQPPYGNLGASSGPWLTHQPHFTSLASNLGIEQNHLVPVQRSSAETRELREAPLKVFPDSQQNRRLKRSW